MYAQRVTLHPVAGKVAEVETLLTDRVTRRQAQGADVALHQRLTGEGATFMLVLRFPDLAAFQTFRTANRADAEFQAYQAKRAPLLVGPGRVELFEVFHPAAAGPPAKYFFRVSHVPALDKVAELKALLEERVQSDAARGTRIALARPVVSDHGPSFDALILHEDLTAFEQSRRTNEADKDFQKFLAKMAGLLRQPNTTELFEILVPFAR